METIVQQEIIKIKKSLEILNFSEKEINEQLDKIGKILLLKISTEILEKKGYRSANGEFNPEDIEKFLKENYSSEEIKMISKEISGKFIFDYFTNITKNIGEEKKAKIESILNA